MHRLITLFFICLIAPISLSAETRSIVDWPSFLSRHDMVWEKLPNRWEEAPFLGNGNMGSMLYLDGEKNRLRLQVFRLDVQDHRDESHGWNAYSRPRLMIGDFYLQLEGKITGGSWRKDLWNAEVRGTVETDKGSVHFSQIVHTDDMVIHTQLQYEGEEHSGNWTWAPGNPKTNRGGYPSSREQIAAFAKNYGPRFNKGLKLWTPNPPVEISKKGDISLSIQNLLSGGQHAVAWQHQSVNAEKENFIISIGKSYPEYTAANTAVESVKKVAATDSAKWIQAHRNWWHQYYPESFISLPDLRMESIYWHQIYKMACATRTGRPMLDTAGPWLQKTPWPYITWDLNVQLCYWPTMASNRLHLAQSLIDTIHDNRQNLIENVHPIEWQKDSAYIPVSAAQDLIAPRDSDSRYYDCVGNLPWAMHNCWLIYRHSMDDELLREKIYPMMRRAANLYLHLIYEKDGKIHLPVTYSPEVGKAPNCNYDLALLRWSCQALLEASERLKINDPLIPKWKDILERLVDYPVDDNGFMRGEGVPWDSSHRHYSHLLMAYPLYLVNHEQSEETKALIKKSYEHWISFDGALVGYSMTGASSLAASIGEGNDALKYLIGLEPFLEPNGLYKEAGPVMETPLSAAQSIHDMIIQSWGNTIRIFPAMPDSWQDSVFHDLRAEGAFLVSAERKDGLVTWVRVKSLAGEPLLLNPGFIETFQIQGARTHQMTPIADRPGTYQIDLKKDEEILLSLDGRKTTTVSPVSTTSGKANSFGLR